MASRFNLDGKSYELPPVDELTMDESILVERYAGTGIEEIGENLPMGAVKALVIIAVMRERPEVREREISERIGKITIKEMGEAWEADESPPALGSPSESEEQPEPSGETGTADTCQTRRGSASRCVSDMAAPAWRHGIQKPSGLSQPSR